MTLYLTDNTTPRRDRARARRRGFDRTRSKYYPAGATTNSDSGVTALERALSRAGGDGEARARAARCTAKSPIADVDVFDRERVFVERTLAAHRARLSRAEDRARARDDARGGGVRRRGAGERRRDDHAAASALVAQRAVRRRLPAALYCLPVLKREAHRRALVAAATSGNPKFFLGTDSRAARAHTRRRRACGCAGCYSAPLALELYAEAFEDAGRARPARRLREPSRRRLLRPAAQRRHGDARARAVDGSGRVRVRRRDARAAARGRNACAGASSPARSATPTSGVSLDRRSQPDRRCLALMRGEESPGSAEQDAG